MPEACSPLCTLPARKQVHRDSAPARNRAVTAPKARGPRIRWTEPSVARQAERTGRWQIGDRRMGDVLGMREERAVMLPGSRR